MKWPTSHKPKVGAVVAIELDRAARDLAKWCESLRAKDAVSRFQKIGALLRRVYVAGEAGAIEELLEHFDGQPFLSQKNVRRWARDRRDGVS